MKKSDLKSGMIIELRGCGENNLGLLVQTSMGLVAQFNETWEDVMDCLDEDLRCAIDRRLDVVSLRQPKYGYQIIRNEMSNAPIIWRRKEEKEITMQEIADKFGCSVDEIKIVE